MTIADIVIAVLAQGTKTPAIHLVDIDEDSELIKKWIDKIEKIIEGRIRTEMSEVIDLIAEIENKDLTYDVMEVIRKHQRNKRNDGTQKSG